jgi:hypothetical protein
MCSPRDFPMGSFCCSRNRGRIVAIRVVLIVQIHQAPRFMRAVFSLDGVHFRASAHVYKYHDVDGMLEVSSMEIDDKIAQRTVWAWRFDDYDAEVTIRDRREGEQKQRKNVTDAEMDRFRFPKPAFGDFDAIVRFVLGMLRSEGYGELE